MNIVGISISSITRFKASNAFLNVVNISVSDDDAYPNPGGGAVGGFDLAPAQLGLTSVHDAVIESDSGYGFYYDTANKKLKAYQYPGDTAGPKAELANEATSLREKTLRMVVIGR